MHFRAIWKNDDSPLERRLRDIAESNWWPAILRQQPADETEQATIWRALQTGGAPWVAALRAATDTVIDRIAWMAVRDIHPLVDAARAAQAKAEAATATAKAEADAARAAQSRAEAAAEMAKAEVDAARAELAKAAEEVDSAKTEVEALRESTSWRVTAPLRGIARSLGRSR